MLFCKNRFLLGDMFLQNLIIKFSDVSRFRVMHVRENYRWFFEWSITFLVQQRWHVLMQVFSSQSISYTHIGIPWLYIFLPSRSSKIWNKTVHSFHSLEENIGDICDDLQKMCFVVVFLKKILLKSWQIFNVLDWTDWQFKRSKANITLPKDQLKIVLCVCVLQAANVLAGKNCCYQAPAKNFFSNYSN